MKPLHLRVENISKVYLPGQVVWQGISFDLNPGEFLYILGGSGAGKSSLLRALSSFENPSEGRIACLGVPLDRASHSQIQQLRRKLSYIPQNLGLVNDLTVSQNLEIAQYPLRKSDRVEVDTMKAMIRQLSLDSVLEKKVATLSGGEKQRVAILRGLSKKADLIVADEPTGAQDFEMTWRLMDLFVKQQLRGATIVFATHDLEMVRRLRKRVAILKDGTLKVEDPRIGPRP